MTAAPFQLYIADAWPFIVTAQNQDGSPLNLTTAGMIPGGIYWAAGQQGLALTIGSGISIVNAAAGQFLVTVPETATATAAAQPPTALTYPTRVQVFLTDASANRYTLGILYIIPLDPRSA